MRKVLVVGGAGFIGANLSHELLNKGEEVTILDNFITGDPYNLPAGNKYSIIVKDAEVPIEGDYDLIFHLASPASPIDYWKYPLQTLHANIHVTENILKYALKNKAKVVVASTSEVYGDPLEHPQREGYFGNVNTMGPRSCYDESKRVLETLSYIYSGQGVDVTIARIFNTYGPYMRINDGRVIPSFASSILTGLPIRITGDGKQTRSFCYVDDTVRALLTLADYKGFNCFNVGTREEVSMLDLATIMQNIEGKYVSIEFYEKRQDDPERRRPDLWKISSVLSWEPLIELEEGLKKTLDYFRGVLNDT